MSIKHVVSVSGGKDSLATLLIAINRFGRGSVVPIFCDTGNEHDEVYTYLDYLEEALSISINRLRADFTEEIMAKRMFIARDRRTRREYDTAPVFDADGKPVPKRDGRGNVMTRKMKRGGQIIDEPVQKTKKIGGGRRVRWTNKGKRRALTHLLPSGNPFLDLCMWKGRFPSRMAQFCTQELKTAMAVTFQMELIDAGHTVVSWQGIRRDESAKREKALKFEPMGGSMFIYRPIVEWTAADVFTYCGHNGIEPNPLYLQGMGRVGCMPCINVNKDELRAIAARFPEHIAKIKEWEIRVGLVSKRNAATFIPAPGIKPSEAAAHDIYYVVEWSKTTRGGKQLDFLAATVDHTQCASSYGLCDKS